MTLEHQSLASGRWQHFSLMEQLANVGSEVERTISWNAKGNPDYSSKAFSRALELLELTLDTNLTAAQLRELTRAQELLIDHFAGTNEFQTTPALWQSYFRAFTYAAQLQRGR
jgi:hypothetical protein